METIALSIGSPVHVATFQPGSTSTTIAVDTFASAIADGSRYLQIEILSADSGNRVLGTAAVATIAFGAAGREAAPPSTGGRTDFVPHTLVTRTAGSDKAIPAPGGSDYVVLRCIDGEADLFVIGITRPDHVHHRPRQYRGPGRGRPSPTGRSP